MPLKKKAKPVRSSLSRKYDTKYIGDEPDFTDIDWSELSESDRRVKIARALNWYNYMYDAKKDFRPVLNAYAKSIGWKKENLAYINIVPVELYSSSTVALIRLNQRGMPLLASESDKIDAYMKQILIDGKALKAERDVQAKVIAPTKPKKFDDQDQILYELEYDFEDVIMETNDAPEFNLYDRIKILNTSRKVLTNYVQPWIESRIEEASTEEAKSIYGVRKYKKIVKAYEALLADLERALVQPKRAPTIRMKKATPAVRQVRDLKFQKESGEYKATSVHPEKIVGATDLLVFNTKYRKLIWFNSSGGFEVSGSTLKNVTKAEVKTLRKPEEQLTEFLTTNAKTKLLKSFTAIKSKVGNASPRLNESCIILKAL
jgi:hypothetical protein